MIIPIYLSIYLSICLSDCLSVCPSIHPSIDIEILAATHQPSRASRHMTLVKPFLCRTSVMTLQRRNAVQRTCRVGLLDCGDLISDGSLE